MSTIDRLIDNKIAQNLFIWFFFFLILLTTIQADNKISTAFFVILLLAPSIYINNLLVLPFFKKNIGVFFILFILNTLLFTVVSVCILQFIDEQPFLWSKFINFLGIMVLVLVFASAMKISRDSFTRRQHEKDAELKLLKAQLNPHFLFNTLNNLYGLSVMKSENLPNLMLKLSDLLRYSLYETKETFVLVEKEVKYLENYMSLEKIRLEDTTDINFTTSGNLASKEIAPMLFIVFVENAFKHLGVSKEGNSQVNVSLREENNVLYFNCENAIDLTHLNSSDLEKGKSGIGLINAKKRLALIYPEKHSLLVNKNTNTFKVELTIHL